MMKQLSKEHKRNLGEAHKGKICPFKGMTLEQIHGKEKACRLRENQSKLMKGRTSNKKNKTYEEIYGVKKAKELKKIMSTKHKGQISWIKGKHHTEDAKRKNSEAHKGEKSYRFRKDITKDKILGITKQIVGEYGNNIGRRRLRDLLGEQLDCSSILLFNRCKNLDSILNELNIDIKKNKFEKNISKEQILQTTLSIINKYGNDFNCGDLGRLLCDKLWCSRSLIDKKCGSITAILKDLDVKISKRVKWRAKEQLIEDIISEREGEIQTQQYHKGVGRPDIETKDKVYEAKSYLYMGWKDQFDRYSKLNKEVKFVVFEDKGETDIPKEKIIFIKEWVKELPDNKRLLIQERIERIKMGIPLGQLSLKVESNS